jgi:hypothetical protein
VTPPSLPAGLDPAGQDLAFMAAPADARAARLVGFPAAAPSGRPDEFVDLPTLPGLSRGAGFAAVQVHGAHADERDRFESGGAARIARWPARHPADHPANHPDADAVRDRLRRQSDADHRGYRGVRGLTTLGLLAV